MSTRRERYMRRSQRREETGFKMNLDNSTLDVMCRMMVTDSQHVRRGSLIHLQQLLDINDDPGAEGDSVKQRKLAFIHRGLDARLNYGLTDPDMILHHIAGGLVDDTEGVEYRDPLDADELEWLNQMISEALNLYHLDKHVDRMMDVCSRYKATEFGSKGAIAKEFVESVSQAQNAIRQTRHEDVNDEMFDLSEGSFETYVGELYDDLTSPRSKLKTGMQGMNELLSGGFENGRVYVYFGLQGEGKSMMLLNLARQIKMYNRGYKCKDPTKKPCVVLLTMENSAKETTKRLFSISTNVKKITDVSKDAAIHLFRDDMALDPTNPINIFIKFKPSNSEDTSYLYTLYDDLYDMGYEPICFIQDYLGRIRSTEYNTELRIEFGKVVDEFKVFAEDKDIPFISAGQLNRDATKHVDEGRKQSKADLVRLMGRSNIGESMLILNNVDGAFLLAPEVTRNGDRYMGVQCIKHRYDPPEVEFVYIPYHEGNTIKLSEDYGREPNYKLTLRDDFLAGNANPSMPKQSQYQTNGIQELTSLDDDGIVFNAEIYGGDNVSNAHDHSNIDELASVAYQCHIARQRYIEPMVFYQNYQDPMVFFDSEPVARYYPVMAPPLIDPMVWF